jgi:putative DNA primase/helicase
MQTATLIPPVPHTDNLPDELKGLRSFVAWRYEQVQDEKTGEWTITKVPYRVGGYQASHSRPEHWTTFERAMKYVNNNTPRFGLGFVFSEDDPYCGVDLDDCRDPETGEIEDWAREIIESLNSYAEISPSETGVKIIVKAKLPEYMGSGGRMYLDETKTRAIEVYHHSRFFTITGNHLDGTPEAVNGAQEATDGFLETHFPKPTKATSTHTFEPTGLTDDKVLAWALKKAKNAPKNRRLYEGDTTGYGDSEAQAALIMGLAFYSGDPDQVYRLMQGSKLKRDK